MDPALQAKLDEVQQSLCDTYEMALCYGDDVDKSDALFLNIMEEALNINHEAKRYEEALQIAKMQATLESFDNEYSAKLRATGNSFQAKRSNDYKTFQQRLHQIKSSFETENSDNGPAFSQGSRVECEEFVMETEICITDPLTKRQMENPVKNKICGHHYEKSSILEAITINRRLRCPVAGCGNNQFVQKSHLIDDDAFKRRLANLANQSQFDDDDPLG